jgi:excisionase family DNA binding protein
MDNSKRLTLTVDSCARLLGLSRNSCYEGIKRGEIPHIKVGKRILIPRRALEKMLEGNSGARDSSS